MTRSLTFLVATICAVVTTTCFEPHAAIALQRKSTGMFNRVGVISAITADNITVTHDDGRQIDYSTEKLLYNSNGKIEVKGSLPTSFIDPGMVLTASVPMSPMGEVKEPVKSLQFVNDQSDKTLVERTDTPGICRIVGKVIRKTGAGLLLKVPKSPLARQGRVELATTPETKLTLMGTTYEGDLNVISSITIELSPHRQQKTEELSPNDQLLQKYAYLSDENATAPRKVKLKNFVLHTDISDRQAKVLGMKLEAMHEVVQRYYKKRPKKPIECQIIADSSNWTSAPLSRQAEQAYDKDEGYSTGSPRMPGKVVSCDDHDIVLRTAFDAYCKTTFGSKSPQWYSGGMPLMANYWELNDKKVSVGPEIVAYLKSSPPSSLSAVLDNATTTSKSSDRTAESWKANACCWALCYMMINNSNYSKEFRSMGMKMMMGMRETFELTYEGRMQEIDFEYRQFLKNFDIGYREDLCKWNWRLTPKKLFGSDMIGTDVNARAGWQATKVRLVQGETYEYVAKGEWQTDPEFETSTASGLNGEGRLIGTIFSDYQLSETIRMGERGKFVASTDGQLFLRCDDKWNKIEDNKGRLKVFVRKAQ